MRNLVRNGIILLACLLISIWAIIPPSKQLRLGKDLAGGATLVYSVEIKPGESDVIPRVIKVIKERIDPNGVMEISIVAQGSDRIEITMPLPNDDVKKLKAKFEAELAKFATGALSRDEFERVASLPVADRNAEINRLAAGDADRIELLKRAASALDDLSAPPCRPQRSHHHGRQNPLPDQGSPGYGDR
jgi:preprotein translocase subunit SecD